MTARAYGLIRKRRDRRDYRFTPPRAYTGAFVDLSARFPERPWDQGALGSCVAQGGAACAELARVRGGQAPLNRPSRLFLYYQGRVHGGYPVGQDTGLQIRDVFTVLAKDGGPPENTWKYDVTRFAEKPPQAAYADALRNRAVVYGAVAPAAIDDTIASGYPVAFGFPVFESFESVGATSSGIIPVPDRSREELLGWHCMVFTSTPKDGAVIGGIPGVSYRKARNSWGQDWGLPGDRGHCWFPVGEADGIGPDDDPDAWMVTTMTDPDAPKPPPPPAPWPCHWLRRR